MRRALSQPSSAQLASPVIAKSGKGKRCQTAKQLGLVSQPIAQSQNAPLERVAEAAKKATAAREGLPTASDSAPQKDRNANSDSV
jgi:hypothetical protein